MPSINFKSCPFLEDAGYAPNGTFVPFTAEELDAMSPDQRAQVVREHIVTDLDHLPDAFRQRVEKTAARLAEQLRPVTE